MTPLSSEINTTSARCLHSASQLQPADAASRADTAACTKRTRDHRQVADGVLCCVGQLQASGCKLCIQCMCDICMIHLLLGIHTNAADSNTSTGKQPCLVSQHVQTNTAMPYFLHSLCTTATCSCPETLCTVCLFLQCHTRPTIQPNFCCTICTVVYCLNQASETGHLPRHNTVYACSPQQQQLDCTALTPTSNCSCCTDTYIAAAYTVTLNHTNCTMQLMIFARMPVTHRQQLTAQCIAVPDVSCWQPWTQVPPTLGTGTLSRQKCTQRKHTPRHCQQHTAATDQH